MAWLCVCQILRLVSLQAQLLISYKVNCVLTVTVDCVHRFKPQKHFVTDMVACQRRKPALSYLCSPVSIPGIPVFYFGPICASLAAQSDGELQLSFNASPFVGQFIVSI